MGCFERISERSESSPLLEARSHLSDFISAAAAAAAARRSHHHQEASDISSTSQHHLDLRLREISATSPLAAEVFARPPRSSSSSSSSPSTTPPPPDRRHQSLFRPISSPTSGALTAVIVFPLRSRRRPLRLATAPPTPILCPSRARERRRDWVLGLTLNPAQTIIRGFGLEPKVRWTRSKPTNPSPVLIQSPDPIGPDQRYWSG